ncbi:hypothetical protein O3M35_008534 [Rhynocoris fuscipes]|uniref:Uncharacterized protein n=1 Tax=Rhynocoris fuscipes TaxID=488301 RepID=A0AAW1D9B7_9HEMI
MRNLYQNFKSIGPTVFPMNRSKLRILGSLYFKNCFSHISKTALATLLNLALISFWALSANQGCHFTSCIKHILRCNSVIIQFIDL